MRKREIRIKVKVKDYQIIVNVKISPYLVLNSKQSELLVTKYNHGFLKLENIKKNKLRFIGPIGISLSERLKKTMSEYDFFFVIEQIIDSVQKIERIGLSRNNVVWDLDYIFFSESTKELSFVYLPISTPHGGVSINSLIEQIIYSIKPLEGDTNYLSRFSYYIKSLDEFNTKEVEKYISELHPQIIKIISGEVIKPEHSKSYKEDKECKTDDKNIVLEIKDEDATYLELEDDEETCIREDEEEETQLIEDDVTSFVDDVNVKDYRYPSLIRTATGECIKVNKPVFRIGKLENCVDYVITNNVAISRSHIDIITRGRKCFVFDLRSKNKTYVNNRVIPTEHEVEIFDGDILRLADEELLFRM